MRAWCCGEKGEDKTVKAQVEEINHLIDCAFSKTPTDEKERLLEFRAYLAGPRQAVESLLFVYNAKHFLNNKQTSKEEREQQIQQMCDIFLRPDSTFPVNLNGTLAQSLRSHVRDADAFAADLIDAQNELVRLLMEPYRDWCKLKRGRSRRG